MLSVVDSALSNGNQDGARESCHQLAGIVAIFRLGELEQLTQLDKAYYFTGTKNGEVAQRWYPLAVRSGYTQANAAIGRALPSVIAPAIMPVR